METFGIGVICFIVGTLFTVWGLCFYRPNVEALIEMIVYRKEM